MILDDNKMALLPLVIDLDGTLLKSDLLLETYMAFLRNKPLSVFKPFFWLAKGKTTLKENLALTMDIDVSVLPYDEEVIVLIKSERNRGRKIILATASHQLLAERIAAYLQLFDEVLASNIECNLSAEHKRDKLIKKYGEQGFDYMGNSHDDIPVWKAAKHAHIVNPESGVEKIAVAHGNVLQIMHTNVFTIKDWLKAFRLHQWLKNLLIFVTLLSSHKVSNLLLFGQGILAFLCFGLCASSVYILNDLLDITDDRHHKTKRNRPFASGKLSIKSGIIVFPILLIGSFLISYLILPFEFILVLTTYYILTLVYSLSLKRYMAIDVITLAGLYTIRIVAGAAAFSLELTFWILAFSMFIFLSLALVKRYSELFDARQKDNENNKTRGRGYYPNDLGMISSLGSSAAYSSVLVLALYIYEQSDVGLYKHPKILWLACPLLLFWITRVWLLTHRGLMHEDPVVFAIRDRISLMVGVIFALVFWLAI